MDNGNMEGPQVEMFASETNEKPGALWGCAALIVLSAFLFVRYAMFSAPALGAALSAALFYGACLTYLRFAGRKQSRASYGYLALCCLLALNFALFENAGIQYPLLALLLCLTAYWLITAAGSRRENALGGRAPEDFLRITVKIPFRAMGPVVGRMQSGLGQGKRGAVYGLVGLAASVPLLLIVGSLLMSADSRFEQILQGIARHVFVDDVVIVIFQLVLAALIAWYLLGALYGAAHALPVESAGEKRAWYLPTAISSVVLTLLCLLYALFCAVQVLNIAGFIRAAPRDASAYSQYARQGFFELCGVAVINLAVYLFVTLLTPRGAKVIHALLSALGVLTLLIIATACLKMGLYIGELGLTLLRVYTTWFMAVLFVVFCLLVAAQWARFPAARAIALFCAAAFIAMGLANVGGIVAGNNVSRYLTGSLPAFDMTQYDDFPYAAAPALSRLHAQTEDADLRLAIEDFAGQWLETTDTPLLAMSWQRARGENLLREIAGSSGK